MRLGSPKRLPVRQQEPASPSGAGARGRQAGEEPGGAGAQALPGWRPRSPSSPRRARQPPSPSGRRSPQTPQQSSPLSRSGGSPSHVAERTPLSSHSGSTRSPKRRSPSPSFRPFGRQDAAGEREAVTAARAALQEGRRSDDADELWWALRRSVDVGLHSREQARKEYRRALLRCTEDDPISRRPLLPRGPSVCTSRHVRDVKDLTDVTREKAFRLANSTLLSHGCSSTESKSKEDLGAVIDATDPRCIEFVRLVEDVYRRKEGDIVDELCENLRTCDVGDHEGLGQTRRLDPELLQRLCDELQAHYAEKFPRHNGLALLCARLYTQQDADIDRMLLLPDCPSVPGSPSRQAPGGEREQSDRSPRERVSTARNSTFFKDANAAMRCLWDVFHKSQSRVAAEASLSKWVRWMCALGALAQPLDKPRTVTRCLTNLPRAAVKELQDKRAGDLIFWPAASNATYNADLCEDIAKRSRRRIENVVIFTINSVLEGFDATILSQYPEEEEMILPLFTVLKVRSVTANSGEPLRVDCRFCRSLVLQRFQHAWWQDLRRASARLRDEAGRLCERGLERRRRRAEEEHQRRKGEAARVARELEAVKRMGEDQQRLMALSDVSHQEELRKTQLRRQELQQLQLRRERLQRQLKGLVACGREAQRIYEEETEITLAIETLRIGDQNRRRELRQAEQRRRAELGRSRSHLEEAGHAQRHWAALRWQEELARLREETEGFCSAHLRVAHKHQAGLERAWELMEELEDLDNESEDASHGLKDTDVGQISVELLRLHQADVERARSHQAEMQRCRTLLEEAEQLAGEEERQRAERAQVTLDRHLQLHDLLLSSKGEAAQEHGAAQEELADAVEELSQTHAQWARYMAAEARILPPDKLEALRAACHGPSLCQGSMDVKSLEAASDLRGAGAKRLAIPAGLQRLWEQKPGTIAEELLANLQARSQGDTAKAAAPVDWKFLAALCFELYDRSVAAVVRNGSPLKPLTALSMALCVQQDVDVDRFLLLHGENVDRTAVPPHVPRRQRRGSNSGVACNGQVLCEANRALRRWCENFAVGEPNPAARSALERWVKWLCLMDALTHKLAAPQAVTQALTGLSAPVLELLRCKRTGDEVIIWGLASTTLDPRVASSVVNETAPLDRNVLLHISGVTEGLQLSDASPYANEQEMLLPLFTRLRVIKSLPGPPLELHCEYLGSLMASDFRAQCLEDLHQASDMIASVIQDAQTGLQLQLEERNSRCAVEVCRLHQAEQDQARRHRELMEDMSVLLETLERKLAEEEARHREAEAEAAALRLQAAEREAERRRAAETNLALRQRREVVRSKLHASSWWDGKGHLRVKHLDEAGIKDIAFVLPDDESMTKLFLHECDIADQGMEAIANAVRENRTLRILSVRYAQVSDVGAKELGSALKVNRSLELLNLQNNMIGDAGMEAIADALRENTSLKEVWLSHNCCGDDGAEVFADAVRVNLTLRKLELSGNFIGALGKAALLEGMWANGKVEICGL